MDSITTEVDVVRKGSVTKELVVIPFNEGSVKVDVLFNGVCKSDIRVYLGLDKFLGSAMCGHEGVGIVTESKSPDYAKGDLVATCWHPCFTKVSVWAADRCISLYRYKDDVGPHYIIQPVACVIEVLQYIKAKDEVLVLGSGYFAQVLSLLGEKMFRGSWDFYGTYNHTKLKMVPVVEESFYDVVINVSGKSLLIDVAPLVEGGTYINVANADSNMQVDSWEASWKNIKIIFTSPRSSTFMQSMVDAFEFIHMYSEEFLSIHDEVIDGVDTVSYDSSNALKDYLNNFRRSTKASICYNELKGC